MSAASWRGTPVLVTGATGLLGGWLVKTLVERGAVVVALIRDGSPQSLLAHEGWMERITVVRGELKDLSLLRRALCEYGIDTVFHLAAQPLVGVAKRDPVGTFEANIQGTWNVLEAARQAQTRRVLVASSDKAYGASDRLPYAEDHPLQGRFPYDVSKSCADLLAHCYFATYGLPVGIARCANLFGGGDLNFSRTIPGLIRDTLAGRRFEIRSDGLFVRDFLYVADAAEAYLRLAEALAEEPRLHGQAFNFGLGIRVTVLELVRKVLALMGREELEPVILNQASSEIREQYMLSEKARRELGWTPRRDLDQGLRETIAWYRAYLAAENVCAAAS